MTESETNATPLGDSALTGTETVSTPFGPMSITDGYPDDATVQLLFDIRDQQRAVELMMWSLPIAQFQAFMEQQAEHYPGDFAVYQSFNEHGGIVTANGTTPYIVGFKNLSETGPIVIDMPAGKYAAGVLDWWQAPVCDLGLAGPDGGNGGRYVIVGPDSDPADFESADIFAFRSPTNKVFLGFRVLEPGTAAIDAFFARVRIGTHGSEPVTPSYVSNLDRPWAATAPTGLPYFEMVHRAIQKEAVVDRDKAFMGYLRNLGIEDGKPFKPTPRQAELLTNGSKLGELLARSNAMEPYFSEPFYEGTSWYRLIDFPVEQDDAVRYYLDERSAFFYEAITTSKGMTTETPGLGQVYLGTKRDADGNVLQGGQTYRIRIPKDAPALQFWSIVVYDVPLRLFVRTPQQNAVLSSRSETLQFGEDGSCDIFTGPDASAIPTGMETNFIQTNPGEGWFPYLRLYAPTEPFFDKSWNLPDIERIG